MSNDSRRKYRNDPAFVSAIAELYKEGLTLSKIAKKLNTTRGVVAGQINRLGIKNREESHGQAVRAGMKARNARLGIENLPPEPYEIEQTTVPEPKSLAVKFADNTGCKWADDDLNFCGHARTHGPYCQHHHERSRTETPPLDLWILDLMRYKVFQ